VNEIKDVNNDCVFMCQVLIDRLPLPFAECVDITNGEHDFERNVYEEMYPETLYSLEVV